MGGLRWVPVFACSETGMTGREGRAVGVPCGKLQKNSNELPKTPTAPYPAMNTCQAAISMVKARMSPVVVGAILFMA